MAMFKMVSNVIGRNEKLSFFVNLLLHLESQSSCSMASSVLVKVAVCISRFSTYSGLADFACSFLISGAGKSWAAIPNFSSSTFRTRVSWRLGSLGCFIILTLWIIEKERNQHIDNARNLRVVTVFLLHRNTLHTSMPLKWRGLGTGNFMK